MKMLLYLTTASIPYHILLSPRHVGKCMLKLRQDLGDSYVIIGLRKCDVRMPAPDALLSTTRLFVFVFSRQCQATGSV